MKKIFFISFIFILISCKGQEKDDLKKSANSNKMIEKFDYEVYKKTEYGNERFLKKDGNEIIMMGFLDAKGGFQKEFLPKPAFTKIYKEFYPNGNIKKKETIIGEYTKIGVSEYFNEDGTVERNVDEDTKFGKIKYNDVLKFLNQKKYINLKTGEGREDEDGRPVFEISFKEENGKKKWFISIVKGKPNNNPENYGIGEPPSFLSIHYIMDGETGIVTNG